MKAGENAFDDPDARSDEASFRDDESTRRYIDTAIARNIQRSLRCFNHGRLSECDPAVVSRVRDKVLEDVKGRMLEDIVLSETVRAHGRNEDPVLGTSVFKLAFPRGEFDMVVRRPATNECELFEIKHATVSDDRQARHLRNEKMLAEVERRFGKVSSRSVLYRGKSFRAEDGVRWRNVEEFLGGRRGDCAISI